MKRKILNLLLVFTLVISASFMSVLSALAGEVYESYTVGEDSTYPFGVGTYLAQTFTPSVTHDITAVTLLVSKSSISANYSVTVQIRETTGGVPNASILLSTIGNSVTWPVTADTAWYTFNFATSTTLSSGTMYAIVMGASTASPSGLYWMVDLTSPTYAGGTQAVSADWGATWGAPMAGNDLMFQEGDYYEPTAPAVVTNDVITSGDNLTFSANITDIGTADNATSWGTHIFTITYDYMISHNGTQTSPFGFEDTVSGSTINMTVGEWYAYRGWAISSIGTGYGDIKWFQFSSEPEVTTQYASHGSDRTLWFWGSVEDKNNLIDNQYGFEFGTDSANLSTTVTARLWTAEGSETTFFDILSSNFFEFNETYYYRAYATNAYGTGYGDNLSIVYLPTLYEVTSLYKFLDLTVSGNFTAEFNVEVEPLTSLLNVHVRLSTSPSFTDNITSYVLMGSNNVYLLSTWNGTGTNLGQLLPDTTYYWQGYATIDTVTYWGEVMSFTTGGGISDLPIQPLIELISITDISDSYATVTYVFESKVKITEFTDNVTGETSDFINYYGVEWGRDNNFQSVYTVRGRTLQPDGTFSLALKFDSFTWLDTAGLYAGETLYFRAFIKTTNYARNFSNVIIFEPITASQGGGVVTPTIPIIEVVDNVKQTLGLSGLMGSWAFMGLILIVVALCFGIGMAYTKDTARNAVGVGWILCSISVVGAFVFTGELGIWPIVILVGAFVVGVFVVGAILLGGRSNG